MSTVRLLIELHVWVEVLDSFPAGIESLEHFMKEILSTTVQPRHPSDYQCEGERYGPNRRVHPVPDVQNLSGLRHRNSSLETAGGRDIDSREESMRSPDPSVGSKGAMRSRSRKRDHISNAMIYDLGLDD